MRSYVNGGLVRKIYMELPRQQEEDELVDYVEHCVVCGDLDVNSKLIFCDSCQQG